MPYSMEFIKPAEIETQSFAIIEAELRRRNVSCPANQMPILQRVIHTSADFDYIQNLTFSENAVEKALDALRNGADIIVNTDADDQYIALCPIRMLQRRQKDVASHGPWCPWKRQHVFRPTI